MLLKNRKTLYDGRYLQLNEATYATETGREKKYEFVSRIKEDSSNNTSADAVGIIAMNAKGDKILIGKEFRMAVNSRVYNFPAGLIDPGEAPVETAIRELFEETGLELYDITSILGPAVTAAGISDEKVTTVVGKARGSFRPSNSDVEEIVPGWYGKDEVRVLIEKGTLMSLRTQSFLALWSGYIR
jgi:ADP-ribose pyrophosphatase